MPFNSILNRNKCHPSRFRRALLPANSLVLVAYDHEISTRFSRPNEPSTGQNPPIKFRLPHVARRRWPVATGGPATREHSCPARTAPKNHRNTTWMSLPHSAWSLPAAAGIPNSTLCSLRSLRALLFKLRGVLAVQYTAWPTADRQSPTADRRKPRKKTALPQYEKQCLSSLCVLCVLL
jgi:hypothetical protein